MTTQNDIISFIEEKKEFFQEKFSLSKIGIFGSYANGRANESSDIDILIEFEGSVNNIHKIKEEIKNIFETRFNTHIDICREKYIKPYFRELILNEAIYI
jgi:uncharacterized protein